MDPAILTALSLKCEEVIRYFCVCQVSWTNLENSLTRYLCVGVTGLFIIKLGFSADSINEPKIHFGCLEELIEDIRVPTELLLSLSDSRPQKYPKRVFVTSNYRETLCDFIQAAWQTNNMIATSSSKGLIRYKSHITSTRVKEPIYRCRPFRGFRVITHEGYQFHIYRHYEATGRFEGDDDGCNHFEDPSRGFVLTLRVSIPMQVEHLQALGHSKFQVSAAQIRNDFCLGGEFKIYRDERYIRKCNLTADIAKWEGWEFLFGSVSASPDKEASESEQNKKEKPFVCALIVLRRSYIPPLCDLYQEIVITVKMTHEDMRLMSVQPLKILDEARRVAAFVAPVDNSNVIFKDLIKARMDSLAYPPAFYSEMKYRIKLEPMHMINVKRYIVSLLSIIADEYPLAYPEVIDEAGRDLDPSEPVAENPKAVVMQMVQNPPGLEDIPDSALNKQQRLYEWETKVAKFLAFYVNNGLCGFKFGLDELMEAVAMMFESDEGETNESDEIIRQEVLFLLHVRPRNPDQPYSPKALKAMLSPHTDPTKDFTFNEEVLSEVLKAGECLNKLIWGARHAEVPENVKSDGACTLLCALLASSEVSDNLKDSACELITRAAAGAPIEETGLFRMTPAISRRLSQSLCVLVRGMSQGSKLFVSACQALINMGAQSAQVKQRTGTSGCAENILNVLKSADDDSATYALLLLVQISKDDTVRQILFECQAVVSVLEYLVNRFYTPNPKILKQAFMFMATLLENAEVNASLKNAKVPVKIIIYVIRDANLNRSDKVTFDLYAKGMFVLAKLLAFDHERRAVYGDEILECLTDKKLLMSSVHEEFVAGCVLTLSALAVSSDMVTKIKFRGLHRIVDRIRAIKSLCTEFLAEKAMDFEKELKKTTTGFR
eukprot:GDKK01064950.1.p1 GENE.GDKK01064950.1~~GDKK01064950.1.p1  ORF type:complete len:889 (+),score=143.21 GDKK01064950.1:31-2697(+)